MTLGRHDLRRSLVVKRFHRKLPDVLSVEEVARLLEAAPGLNRSVICCGRSQVSYIEKLLFSYQDPRDLDAYRSAR